MYGQFRGRRLIASALVLVLTLFVISLSSRIRPIGSPVERFVFNLLAPIQRFAGRLLSPLASLSQEISRLRVMREENILLREKVLTIPGLEAKLNEMSRENARFEALLGFGETLGGKPVAARVVGRNPDDWFGTLTIDRGSDHGVFVDDIAIHPAGLVGRIVRVDKSLSIVMLLTDPDSGAGCICQRSRDAGVLVGQVGSERLKMRIFSRDADVQLGDAIVTSGLGSRYPKGLPIGLVTQVGKSDYGLAQAAEVEPFVDFDRLEEVLIVKFGDLSLEMVDR